MRNRCVGIVVLVGVIFLIGWWVLDRDSWPFVRSVRAAAHDRLVEMIDKHKIAVERARHDYEDAAAKMVHVRQQVAGGRAKCAGIDRKVTRARQELALQQQRLSEIETYLKQGRPVRLVDGSALSSEETRNRIESIRSRIETAGSRVSAFEDLAQRRRNSLAAMDTVLVDGPVRLAHLKVRLDALDEKLCLLNDLRTAYADAQDMDDASFAASVDRAIHSVEAADDELEVALAGIGGLEITKKIEGPLQVDQDEKSVDGLLDLIQSIRADNRLAFGK